MIDWIRTKLRSFIETSGKKIDTGTDDDEDEETKGFSVVKRYQ